VTKPLRAAGYDTCLNSEIMQSFMLIDCEIIITIAWSYAT